MEESEKGDVLKLAEEEVATIVDQRSTTFHEKRINTLANEIVKARSEFALNNVAHSSMYLQRELVLRRDAVRDSVLYRFNLACETRSKFNLSWDSSSLYKTSADLQSHTDKQFAVQKAAMEKSQPELLAGWVLSELDHERETLNAEIKREISALLSETKLREITTDQRPRESRSIHINISGGQIGVLNIAGLIDTIEQNLSTVYEKGGKEITESVKQLSEAVAASTNLRQEQIMQALEHLEFLSLQAALQPDKRAKPGVVATVFSALRGLISVSADIAQIWSTWGPKLESILRSTGII